MNAAPSAPRPSREQLIHRLYEAAELEHCLMCTYLYAAFSLRSGTEEGLSASEAAAVERWRHALLGVAIEEMGHLTAVWNITSALGAAPRFGRANFPLDPGILPAGMVVKLAPFGEEVLQHFIHLERPESSTEAEGLGFVSGLSFRRGVDAPRLTPMALDYDTVGTFYASLDSGLRAFVDDLGEAAAFSGDPALQLGPTEVDLVGAKPVLCLKTARAAFTAIVEQGEGAPQHSADSHFQRFTAMREELAQLKAANPAFCPAWPAAENPVLRPPLGRTNRVWIEAEEAARAVDLANAGYALMLRLIAYSYQVPRSQPEKALSVDLAIGLMRAVTLLGERAARLPAGPANPGIHAGMSFTALRDAAPLPPRPSARRFFSERLGELSGAAAAFAKDGDARSASAARVIESLCQQAARGFANVADPLSSPPPVSLSPPPAASPSTIPAPAPTTVPAPASSAALLPGPPLLPTNPVSSAAPPVPATPVPAASTAPTTVGTPFTSPVPPPSAALPSPPPTPIVVDGVDHIEGRDMTLLYEGKKCIHSRFCVTWGPKVFLANVQGPWIHPDAAHVDQLVEIAHACPSGAIRYRRKDGKPNEAVPQVNLIAVREGGPYAVRADLHLNGESGTYRATLCRCGASKNKPFCDGSHHEIGFDASGEPPTGKADMLPVRDGPLRIEPQVDGPLQVRGNLEITSGTGRVVARVVQARLCRCGGSSNKPFCDGTHARIGFRSS
jgi:CDGSH-type Zn-finger protein/uncharacterized Fe-S cluster protein YjdI